MIISHLDAALWIAMIVTWGFLGGYAYRSIFDAKK